MSILLSGDFHANAVGEISFITKKNLIAKYGRDLFDTITYHIILGDGGFLWPGNEKTDAYNYKILARRPFPVLCVMGNHEPVLGRPELPEIDIGIGEKVIGVNENPLTAYLKRGKIYRIEDWTFLVLGGALSVDRAFRKPGKSWWEREYWTEDEKEALFDLLRERKNFDYVLTHTGPGRINELVFRTPYSGNTAKFSDEVAALNERIDGGITCKQWFCGHWHKDVYHYDENRERGYQYLYKKTALLRKGEIIIRG
ncbi:MAG: metallophosphoesterase [Treponema sp.]|jgi:hypothetical protein|nr:metallophosphoesterase [Treponema sp.]